MLDSIKEIDALEAVKSFIMDVNTHYIGKDPYVYAKHLIDMFEDMERFCRNKNIIVKNMEEAKSLKESFVELMVVFEDMEG